MKKPTDKRYILYATDEFTKNIKGKLMPNKEAKTIVKALQRISIQGQGFPKKS